MAKEQFKDLESMPPPPPLEPELHLDIEKMWIKFSSRGRKGSKEEKTQEIECNMIAIITEAGETGKHILAANKPP